MLSGNFTLFAANKDKIAINDLLTATIKCALVGSGYTPDATSSGHNEWADVSANEIAAGNGYTAGGATIANDLATAIAGGFKYSSDNIGWTATGGNIPAWRYAVFYVSGSLWGLTNPLLGYFVGDATPQDVPATSSGQPLTLQCPANGWFDAT